MTIDAYLIFRAVLEKGSKPSRGRPFGPPFPGGVPKAEIGCGEVIGNRRCCFPGRTLLPAVLLFRDSPDRSGLLFSGVVRFHGRYIKILTLLINWNPDLLSEQTC